MRTPATTRMSSRGQVVIPDNIRKLLRLDPGTTFIVVARGDTVVLQRVKEPRWEQIGDLTSEAQKQAINLGQAMGAFRRAFGRIQRETSRAR